MLNNKIMEFVSGKGDFGFDEYNFPQRGNKERGLTN